MDDKTQRAPDKIDRRGLREAADALGIEWSHVESTLAGLSKRNEEEAEPDLPLEVEPLSDVEWKVIRPHLPDEHKQRSHVDLRTFLDVLLWGIEHGNDWSLSPFERRTVIASMNKRFRYYEAGVFEALWLEAQGSHRLRDGTLGRLEKLAAASARWREHITEKRKLRRKRARTSLSAKR